MKNNSKGNTFDAYCTKRVSYILVTKNRAKFLKKALEPIKKYPKGFPYRALLIISGLEKYYDEMSATEHEEYNHREKALIKLFDAITG